MVLEHVILNVRPGQAAEFEATLAKARPLIAATIGFRALEIRRCVETANRYLLLVTWDTLEDHTVGFRQGPNYAEWRSLLHHFYDAPPTVAHYGEPLPL
jgi:heme-degrading monooxygenase HmoA